MFYLLATDKMVTATPRTTDANGVEITPPQEFKGLKVIQESEDMESLQGLITMQLEDRESDIWKNIFFTITDSDGMQQELYMIYAWLPESLAIRLEPPIEELKEFVPYRGVHFNPFQKEAIDKHLKAAEKASAPAKKRGRPKKAKDVASTEEV